MNSLPPALLVLAIVLAGCASSPSAPTSSSGAPTVVASFLPVYLIVQPVAGNLTAVRILLPPGAEPHDYEPAPNDLKALANASILFYDSPGLEPWAISLAQAANPGIRLAPLSSAVPLRPAAENGTGATDPHVWLSPARVINETLYARDQLIAADPAHAGQYRANAAAQLARLRELDGEYRAGLSNCSSRILITTHAALGYLADDYNLTQVPIAGISPDEEPSPAALEQVIQIGKAENATVVFTEPGVSPKLGIAVAGEIHVSTLAFNPLEILTPEEIANGADYISLMRSNLGVLRQGLGCS
ncbi:MAG: zinc ABC transporter substrate-binding protein [Candidatus Micrarchaeota archaeon]|nr:zinc ABC transporter substrate-binding protein [Candidatus Micrarchaeota archaeon]